MYNYSAPRIREKKPSPRAQLFEIEMTEVHTLVYSRIGDLDIHLDVYLPPEAGIQLIPAVIFFHGGGIFRGNRKSILPEFKGRIPPAGYITLTHLIRREGVFLIHRSCNFKRLVLYVSRLPTPPAVHRP